MVNISTSGFTELGRSLNITCTVVLVEGLVGNISTTWDKMEGISELEDLNLPVETVIDGPVTNVTLILDPVQFEHRGIYMCEAMYNVTQTHDADSLTEDTEVTVNCKYCLLYKINVNVNTIIIYLHFSVVSRSIFSTH